MGNQVKEVKIEPLTDAAFAPFGDIIGNEYKISRFDFGGGMLHMNYVTRPYRDFEADSMEKHTGRQGFISMDSNPFAVIVAGSHDDGSPDIEQAHAFEVGSGKAVVLKENVWHAHDRYPLAPPESKMIVFCSVRIEPPDQTTKVNLKEKNAVVVRIVL